nr:putative sphingolipid transporter spinster like 2 [Quercus suber]
MDSLQPNRSNLEDEEEMDTKPLKDDDSAPTSSPSWFTPKRLLSIFCVINMINYVDRGAIASNGVNGSLGTCTDGGTCTSGSGIQGEFNLSNFEDGVLSSAFMVGLLVASPIFASLSKSHNPFRLIGVGLSVWTLAVIGCGCSFDFWSIAICRMLVGVGEASFISLAAPFIDDHAPPAQKTAWLATFYMCIPAGVALGYVYGGLVGDYLNWRFAFWVEAIFMLPFAVFGFVMKPLQLKGFSPIESKTSSTSVEIASPVIEETSKSTRSTQESTADFQLSTSFWSVDLLKDSDKRPWVLINETTVDSSAGFSNGCLSSGTRSLMSVRRRRGFISTSYMFLK